VRCGKCHRLKVPDGNQFCWRCIQAEFDARVEYGDIDPAKINADNPWPFKDKFIRT
jgi:hypothetical protein